MTTGRTRTATRATPPPPPPRTPRNLLDAHEDRLMACVHCGFCQDACPTYTRLGDELDSPRGRLYLMRAVAEGRIEPDADAFAIHIDRCLGCRACEPVCPSGVQYGFLLERARAVATAARGMPVTSRLLLFVFGNRFMTTLAGLGGRLLRAGGLAGRLAGSLGPRAARLRLALAMLASTRPISRTLQRAIHMRARTQADAQRARLRAQRAAGGSLAAKPGGGVALRDGCVQRALLGHVNAATRRVLERRGWAVTAAPGQRCCGALHAHAGDLDRARALARANIAAFERSGADWIAVNAAGCGAAMKHYGELLEDTPDAERARAFAARVRDVSELLEQPETDGAAHVPAAARTPPSRAPASAAARMTLRVTYDAPCHLIHAQGIADAPLQTLLGAVPWLEAVPLPGAADCCGGAGLYGLTQAELGRTIGRDKVEAVRSTGADIALSANAGCLMQIGGGLILAGDDTPVMHTIALLDACETPLDPRGAP